MAEDVERHIGHRVHAARDRLGWSRETLGSVSGLSWGAIAQMESGRRTNARSDTLLALSDALGVSVEYLLGVASKLPRMLDHQCFAYDTDDQLLATVTGFVEAGAARGEGILLALPGPKLARLRDACTGSGAELVDSSPFLADPQIAFTTYRDFVERSDGEGRPWSRIVAEPPWHGRTPAEARVLFVVESLLEVGFRHYPVTILCPYDGRAIEPGVLATVARMHPHLRSGAEVSDNQGYEGPAAAALGAFPAGE